MDGRRLSKLKAGDHRLKLIDWSLEFEGCSYLSDQGWRSKVTDKRLELLNWRPKVGNRDKSLLIEGVKIFVKERKVREREDIIFLFNYSRYILGLIYTSTWTSYKKNNIGQYRITLIKKYFKLIYDVTWFIKLLISPIILKVVL